MFKIEHFFSTSPHGLGERLVAARRTMRSKEIGISKTAGEHLPALEHENQGTSRSSRRSFHFNKEVDSIGSVN